MHLVRRSKDSTRFIAGVLDPVQRHRIRTKGERGTENECIGSRTKEWWALGQANVLPSSRTGDCSFKDTNVVLRRLFQVRCITHMPLLKALS